MTLTLGAISFNTDVADGNGVTWFVEVDGWDTLSNRVTGLTIPQRHGEVTVENLYEQRQLTLKGTASALDEAGFWAAANLLESTTNVLTRFTDAPLLLTISEEVDKQMAVLRTSLNKKCAVADTIMQFEVTLRADDPFKYAATVATVATSGSAVNAGTTYTFPTFTTSSPGVVVLTAGSQTWSATASLPSGTVIDMGAMSVLNGVTSHFGSVDLASDWIYLPPGTTAVASNVAGTWSWRSAWL